MIGASASFSAFKGTLRSLLDFLFSLKQCVPTAAVCVECLCIRISARACCFSFVHCVGLVHGLPTSAMERFTFLACVHWLQHGGGRYSSF